MAFLLVDRIAEIEPGTRARGSFTLPEDLPDPSPCLIAEAIGQLAAWVAMAKAEFRSRPIAGITGEALFKEGVAPGTTFDLEVGLESCEADSILYDGRASLGDRPIIELSRCVGPMLPMEDFDDPEAVRRRFALLCRTDRPVTGFFGDAALIPRLDIIDHDSAKRLRAAVRVPTSAAFFADHFPRKPVFPGTLILDAKVRLAARLASEALDASRHSLITPTRLCKVKFRSFVYPGQMLEIEAEVVKTNGFSAEITVTAEVGGQRVATARVEAGAREAS